MNYLENCFIPIPNYYLTFAQAIESVNIPCYFSGGCIRNFLLGVPSTDFDLFCLCNLSTLKHRLKQVRFVATFDNVAIVEDLSHHFFSIGCSPDFHSDWKSRDFTINTFYYDWQSHIIYGKAICFLDIRNKKLRPCNPLNFKHNSLQKLRGIRFKETLNLTPSSSATTLYDIDLQDITSRFLAIRIKREYYKHTPHSLDTLNLTPLITEKLHFYGIHL